MTRLLHTWKPRTRYFPLSQKHEQNVQRQVCQYLRLQYPNMIFRSDYASGLQLTMNQAALHKSLQSGRSWVELFVYKPSRGYHGLALEIKREGTVIYLSRGPRKGQLTADPHIQEQALMLQKLNNLGYFARFGVGFDQCRRIID